MFRIITLQTHFFNLGQVQFGLTTVVIGADVLVDPAQPVPQLTVLPVSCVRDR